MAALKKYYDETYKRTRYINNKDLRAFYAWFDTFPIVTPIQARKKLRVTSLGPRTKKILSNLVTHVNGMHITFDLFGQEVDTVYIAKGYKRLIQCGLLEVVPSQYSGVMGTKPWLNVRATKAGLQQLQKKRA